MLSLIRSTKIENMLQKIKPAKLLKITYPETHMTIVHVASPETFWLICFREQLLIGNHNDDFNKI